jgi:glycine hydroxymethyltransferase
VETVSLPLELNLRGKVDNKELSMALDIVSPPNEMRFVARFCDVSSDRIRSIVNMHWGLIGEYVHLIASACYPFPDALRALSEPMCVFPIEGLPGNRYFPGTTPMDMIENRAEEILLQLFGVVDSHRATIQPHSGTQANQVVFNAVLAPDDRVFSLKASQGGHISHSVLVGRRNPVLHYPLKSDATIDYDALEAIAIMERPKLIIAGGSSYPREIDFARIGRIAHANGALFHADVSHTATFIAAGVHAPIAEHADFITFNTVKNMRGPNGGVLIYRKQFQPNISKGLFPDTQGGPNENTMFAKLVGLECLLQIDLKRYASNMVTLARAISETFSSRGITVVTGGTDSHLVLLDLRGTGLTGVEAERLCEQHRVLVSRNLIPNDHEKAHIASGLRIGTSCCAILGYTVEDASRLANWIADRIMGVEPEMPHALIQELASRYNRQLLPEPL